MIYSPEISLKDLDKVPGRILLRALIQKLKNRLGSRPVIENTAIAHPEPGLSRPLTVVDIGASGGMHPRWSRFEEIRGVLVEPDPREVENLKGKLNPKNILLESALSDSETERDFFLCEKQMVSSVYPPNEEFVARFPDAQRFKIVKKLSMRMQTLKGALAQKGIDSVQFIKLDTQGHELAILKGAGSLVDSAIGLEVEVEFAPMYQAQPLFPEIAAFATEHGFELFDLRRHYWQRHTGETPSATKGQLIFGDVLYMRSPESIVARAQNKDDILHAYMVYAAYGYADLILTLLNLAERKGLIADAEKERLKLNSLQIGKGTEYIEGPWHSDEDFGN